LKLSKLAGNVTDSVPSMIGSKNGMVSSRLYKLMHELGLQNELIQDYCIIHKQNLIGKGLELKQIVTYVSAVNVTRSLGLNHRQTQFKMFIDKIESECGDIVYY
jgi:hypothetical protein